MGDMNMMGGMGSGAGANSYQVGPNPNIPQGDMRQGGLAAQYGWGGPSAYGWGGPYGSQSWGAWNQASQNPGQLGGLMGGASSGYPWMQQMGPFMQYLQAGMGGQPGAPGAGSTPAPGAPPTLSSPHFGNMGKMTGAPVAPGQQSPQYNTQWFPQHIQSASPFTPQGKSWLAGLNQG